MKKFKPIKLGVTFNQILGYYLCQCRDVAGITQEDMARRMNLTQSTWSRVENGRSALTVVQLVRAASICRAQTLHLIKAVELALARLTQRGVQVWVDVGEFKYPFILMDKAALDRVLG